MSVLPVGFGSSGSSAIDTGDIPASLRFRSSASAYLSKTITTDATSTYFAAVKRGKLGVISPIFDTNIKFNANDTLTAFGLTTTAVFRDPTSWLFIHVSNGGLYINGVSYGAVTTSALTNPRIGFDGTNYFDGYFARIGCVAGSSSAYTNFGYLNTTINEWVSRSASSIKAVVDAGGTNSFMLDFDDATSLTTLGYDLSTKGNDWTLNNFSLTAGTTYDHMLDVPGNSFATLNPIAPNPSLTASTCTDGNLVASASAANTIRRCTTGFSAGKWYGESGLTTTAQLFGLGEAAVNLFGTNSSTAGARTYYLYNSSSLYSILPGADTGLISGLATGGRLAFACDMDSRKLWLGYATSGDGAITWVGGGDPAAGTSPTHSFASDVGTLFPVLGTNGPSLYAMFGQAPLHASATYHADAGGYFRYAPPTGFKALCQRNLPDPAILNPKNGFVSVIATEDNIYSTLAAARSGWTDYVDILKNRAASESWAWQFSHDSSNEYAVAASSLVRQTKRTQSGSNNWVGYSIRIGATYGTAAGSVSHTNGVATTITHNVGKSARQMILLFNRAGGSAVPVYHPDLTSGELLDLCTTAADAASTAITSVGTNSFQIGSATASGTYDYLVCSEISQFFDLGKWTGNTSADGAYYDAGHKTAMVLEKRADAISFWCVLDDTRNTYNVANLDVYPNSNIAESGVDFEADITALGIKLRTTDAESNASGSPHVTANWASVSGKYSLGR